jgi:hypothetical protein
MKKLKTAFKYDEETVKLFRNFYQALKNAGVSNIIIKQNKTK